MTLSDIISIDLLAYAMAESLECKDLFQLALVSKSFRQGLKAALLKQQIKCLILHASNEDRALTEALLPTWASESTRRRFTLYLPGSNFNLWTLLAQDFFAEETPASEALFTYINKLISLKPDFCKTLASSVWKAWGSTQQLEKLRFLLEVTASRNQDAMDDVNKTLWQSVIPYRVWSLPYVGVSPTNYYLTGEEKKRHCINITLHKRYAGNRRRT